MNLSNLYYNKYIKYKIKYIKLKNSLEINNNLTNITGGGYFYEQNDLLKRLNALNNKKFNKNLYQFSSIYLKANLINKEIIKKYSKIRKTILKNNSFPPHLYHLTLLIFEINLDYPIIGNSISVLDKSSGKRKVHNNLSFLDSDEIKSNFKSIFKNMVLNEENYQILGKLTKINIDKNKEINIGIKNQEMDDCIKYPGSYFVDKFEINNKNLITTFRIKFYEKLNDFMKLEYIKIGGKEKNYVGYRSDNETDPDYILIFYDNFSKDIPLLAIKKFYYGKNTWTPHISIFNMEELYSNNIKFLKKYVFDFLTNKNRESANKILFDELKKNDSVKIILKQHIKSKITLEDIDFELQI